MHNGRGSNFGLRVARASPVASSVTSSDDCEVANGTGALAGSQRTLRLVVVEDNEDARECLVELLESVGHEVEAAEDGLSGLNKVLSLAPDAAIVDIGLPKLDGYSVARQARAYDGYTPFLIAMTGYGLPEDRARARGRVRHPCCKAAAARPSAGHSAPSSVAIFRRHQGDALGCRLWGDPPSYSALKKSRAAAA